MTNEEIKNFFENTLVNIAGNNDLRIPQQEGYDAIREHFAKSDEQCFVQLPVGCGKTGLMGLTPFGLTKGRVLIITPNLTIRENCRRELDISDAECFYHKRKVLSEPVKGPFISELKPGANIHDCDNAHIVVSNIQQFSGASKKWYNKLDKNYFRMILIDENHHNVAASWQDLCSYFDEAIVIGFTATPFRADGKDVIGEKVYTFGYGRSMMMGYISPIDCVYVTPASLTFTIEGKEKKLTLPEVLDMRQENWFSKGIALSEECNRHIVQASIKQLKETKKYGPVRQIIAAACSIRHAVQIAELYHEYGLKSEVLHSKLKKDEREDIESRLRSGLIDVIVQVQILGEGYSLNTLSVAAVFRPYRSLSPYIQFLGRILRIADPTKPFTEINKVYLVSHVGLNDERWWEDFKAFDKGDQLFFTELLNQIDQNNSETTEGEGQRLTLRPFMKIINETVNEYVQKGFLSSVEDSHIDGMLKAISDYGFDPIEFGLTRDMIRRRLEMAQREKIIPAIVLPVQPQRRKEALRVRVAQEARSIADVVVNRLDINRMGGNLKKYFPNNGPNNLTIIISLANGQLNKKMNMKSGERQEASIEQLEKGLKESANIADALTKVIKEKING